MSDGQIYDENTKEYQTRGLFLKKMTFRKYARFPESDMPEKIFNFTTSAPWNKMFERTFVEEKQLKFQDIHRANDLYGNGPCPGRTDHYDGRTAGILLGNAASAQLRGGGRWLSSW